MKIEIDILEEMYKEYVSVNLGRGNGKTITDNLLKAIKNGTPLEQLRDCKTCKHSDNGNCAGTEECHECMWESKYEQ